MEAGTRLDEHPCRSHLARSGLTVCEENDIVPVEGTRDEARHLLVHAVLPGGLVEYPVEFELVFGRVARSGDAHRRAGASRDERG